MRTTSPDARERRVSASHGPVNRIDIDDREWDFEARGKNDADLAELPFCLFYEFARTSEKVKQLFPLNKAPKSLKELRKGVDELPWAKAYPNAPIWAARVIGGFRHFMDRPWFAVPYEIRQKRLKILFPDAVPSNSYLRTAVCRLLFDDPDEDRDYLLDCLRRQNFRDRQGRLATSVCAIQISHRYSRDQLHQSFDALLDEILPPQRDFRDNRGGKLCQHSLEALGIYRLMERGSVLAAMKTTERTVGPGGKHVAKYADTNSMYRVKKNGERLLARFEATGCIDPITVVTPARKKRKPRK